MSLPEITLLAFALWTLLIPLGVVAVYRFGRIFAGTARINAFPADDVRGPDWYRRAMRAHANCVENLPVYAAVVYALSRAHVASPQIDALAVAVIGFRVAQTLVHLAAEQSAPVVSVRFGCYLAQLLAMLGLAGQIIVRL